MKSIKLLGLLFVSILFFSSCQLSEEMTIKDDGSGRISVQMDGSGIMQMMGGRMAQNDEPVKLDTIIVFKNLLEEYKDSIKDLPEAEKMAMEGLKDFKMKIDMDTGGGTMNFDMFSDFKNVDKLNDVFGTFQKASELAMKNRSLGGGRQGGGLQNRTGPTPNSEVSYTYNGKRFTRTTKIENFEEFKKEIDSAMAMVKGMFGTSKYTLKYNFPKKIKSASIEDAMFSSDKKTIIIQKDLLEYMTNPKIFDIEVKFEN